MNGIDTMYESNGNENLSACYFHTFCLFRSFQLRAVFLIASAPNISRMYGTSTALKIQAVIHFVQKAECIVYTLLKKCAFFF